MHQTILFCLLESSVQKLIISRAVTYNLKNQIKREKFIIVLSHLLNASENISRERRKENKFSLTSPNIYIYHTTNLPETYIIIVNVTVRRRSIWHFVSFCISSNARDSTAISAASRNDYITHTSTIYIYLYWGAWCIQMIVVVSTIICGYNHLLNPITHRAPGVHFQLIRTTEHWCYNYNIHFTCSLN